MTWINRWVGVCMVGASAWLSGCFSHPEYALPANGFAPLITDKQEPRVSRSQLSDNPPIVLKKPTVLNETPPAVIGPPPGVIGPPPGVGVTQTSLVPRGVQVAAVRAWVNNRPIFDREVIEMARPGLARLGSMFEPQRSNEMTKVINAELNKLIDSELMY